MPDIPGNTSTTTSILVGGTLTDQLDVFGDHDWVRIELTAGQKITITLDGISLEDPYLRLRDASGALLAENDDINLGLVRDSKIVFTAPTTGTYYIDIGAWDEAYAGTYELSVQVYTPPVYWTPEEVSTQLVSGYWGGDVHAFNVTQGGTITVNLTALTAAGQNLARNALALWSDVIGVTFAEVSSGGQITFDDNETGAFSDGIWSNGIISSTHVNVSSSWLTSYGTSLNSYSFQTYIHETGHALGLGHAGMYNETATYADDALYLNDGWPTTVMSYFDQQEATYFANQAFTKTFVATPMIADIRAMATLYGLSTTTRTGDTTYGFNNNSGRSVYAASVGTITAYTIFDSGGTDTLNYSGFEANQKIDLRPEFFSNVGGGIGNVSIAFNTIIENAIGGGGNDELVGNSANNVLEGRGGNDNLYGEAGNDTLIGGFGDDRLDGGIGIDMASYATASAGVNVNLAAGTAASIGGGDAAFIGNDLLFSIENVMGSNFADVLAGDGGDNQIDGGGGNDSLSGGGGDDVLIGGAGSDAMTGGAGGDTFLGTGAGLNGDTIADLQLADRIHFTDANLAGFTFNLTGNTLTYTGGSMTLQGSFTGYQLVATAAVGGGVQVALEAAVIDTVRNDFNGDGRSDILWRHDSGVVMQWLGQADGSFAWDEAISYALPADWSMVGIGDFNGDGRFDVVWRHDGGNIIEWLGQADGTLAYNAAVAGNLGLNWQVSGVADFNGDGRDDMLWRDETGVTATWLAEADGGFVTSAASYAMPTDWTLAAAADFTGDGRADILWRHDSGVVIQWVGQLDGSFAWDENISYALPTDWTLSGAGDFNGDGRTDLVWRHDTGNVIEWLGQADGSFLNNPAANSSLPPSWRFDGIGDFNGDNRDDLVWRNDDGAMTIWTGQADGSFLPSAATYQMPIDWTIQPESPLI